MANDEHNFGNRYEKAKGRQTRQPKNKRNAVWKPEPPFICHTRELKKSPAWRSLGPQTRELLEFLEVEHMDHGGACNGDLLAPYDQLEQWGLRRRAIRQAIDEAVAFNLLRVTYHGYSTRKPSRFRLTYVPYYDEEGVGCAPSNEWRNTTWDSVARYRETMRKLATAERKRLASKKQNRGGDSATRQVAHLTLVTGTEGEQ